MARLTTVSESTDGLASQGERSDGKDFRAAMPQRIGPEPTAQKQARKPRGKTFKRLVKLVLLLVVLAAIAAGGLFAYDSMRGPTEDELVEAAIETYMRAVRTGELRRFARLGSRRRRHRTSRDQRKPRDRGSHRTYERPHGGDGADRRPRACGRRVESVRCADQSRPQLAGTDRRSIKRLRTFRPTSGPGKPRERAPSCWLRPS
jgi:hypothetical protein